MSTIKEAVLDLLNPEFSVQASMEVHFAPTFRQRVNGSWLDRAAFLDGIVNLRASLDKVTVTVLNELDNGQHYAERHVVNLFMRDGQLINQEVYLFGQRDSYGRFERIEEVTIAVGAESFSAG